MGYYLLQLKKEQFISIQLGGFCNPQTNHSKKSHTMSNLYRACDVLFVIANCHNQFVFRYSLKTRNVFSPHERQSVAEENLVKRPPLKITLPLGTTEWSTELEELAAKLAVECIDEPYESQDGAAAIYVAKDKQGVKEVIAQLSEMAKKYNYDNNQCEQDDSAVCENYKQAIRLVGRRKIRLQNGNMQNSSELRGHSAHLRIREEDKVRLLEIFSKQAGQPYATGSQCTFCSATANCKDKLCCGEANPLTTNSSCGEKPTNLIPLYRLVHYNRNDTVLTTSTKTRDQLMKKVYEDKGIFGYIAENNNTTDCHYLTPLTALKRPTVDYYVYVAADEFKTVYESNGWDVVGELGYVVPSEGHCSASLKAYQFQRSTLNQFYYTVDSMQAAEMLKKKAKQDAAHNGEQPRTLPISGRSNSHSMSGGLLPFKIPFKHTGPSQNVVLELSLKAGASKIIIDLNSDCTVVWRLEGNFRTKLLFIDLNLWEKAPLHARTEGKLDNGVWKKQAQMGTNDAPIDGKQMNITAVLDDDLVQFYINGHKVSPKYSLPKSEVKVITAGGNVESYEISIQSPSSKIDEDELVQKSITTDNIETDTEEMPPRTIDELWTFSSLINGQWTNRVNFRYRIPLTSGKEFLLNTTVQNGLAQMSLNGEKISPQYKLPGKIVKNVTVTGDVKKCTVNVVHMKRIIKLHEYDPETVEEPATVPTTEQAWNEQEKYKGPAKSSVMLRSIQATVKLVKRPRYFYMRVKMENDKEWKLEAHLDDKEWTFSQLINQEWKQRLPFAYELPKRYYNNVTLTVLAQDKMAQVLVNGKAISPKYQIPGLRVKNVTVAGDIASAVVRVAHVKRVARPTYVIQGQGETDTDDAKQQPQEETRKRVDLRRLQEKEWTSKTLTNRVWEQQEDSFKSKLPLDDERTFNLLAKVKDRKMQLWLNGRKLPLTYTLPAERAKKIIIGGEVEAFIVNALHERIPPTPSELVSVDPKKKRRTDPFVRTTIQKGLLTEKEGADRPPEFSLLPRTEGTQILPKTATTNVALKKNAQNFRVDVKMGPSATLRLDAPLRRPWTLSRIVDGNEEKITQFKPNLRMTDLKNIPLTFTIENGFVQLSVNGRNISKKFPLPGNQMETIEVSGDVDNYSVDTEYPEKKQVPSSEKGKDIEDKDTEKNKDDADASKQLSRPFKEGPLHHIRATVQLQPDASEFYMIIHMDNNIAWKINVNLKTKEWTPSTLINNVWEQQEDTFKSTLRLNDKRTFNLLAKVKNRKMQLWLNGKKLSPIYTLPGERAKKIVINGDVQAYNIDAFHKRTLPKPTGADSVDPQKKRKVDPLVRTTIKSETLTDKENPERPAEFSPWSSNEGSQVLPRTATTNVALKKNARNFRVDVKMGPRATLRLHAPLRRPWTLSRIIDGNEEKITQFKPNLRVTDLKNIPLTFTMDNGFAQLSVNGTNISKKFPLPGNRVEKVDVNGDVDSYSVDMEYPEAEQPVISEEETEGLRFPDENEIEDTNTKTSEKNEDDVKPLSYPPKRGPLRLIHATVQMQPDPSKFYMIVRMDNNTAWRINTNMKTQRWTPETLVNNVWVQQKISFKSPLPLNDKRAFNLLAKVTDREVELWVNKRKISPKYTLPGTRAEKVVIGGDVEAFVVNTLHDRTLPTPIEAGSADPKKKRRKDPYVRRTIRSGPLEDDGDLGRYPEFSPWSNSGETRMLPKTATANIALKKNPKGFRVDLNMGRGATLRLEAPLKRPWKLSQIVDGNEEKSTEFKPNLQVIDLNNIPLTFTIDSGFVQLSVNGRNIGKKFPLPGNRLETIGVSGDVDSYSIDTEYPKADERVTSEKDTEHWRLPEKEIDIENTDTEITEDDEDAVKEWKPSTVIDNVWEQQDSFQSKPYIGSEKTFNFVANVKDGTVQYLPQLNTKRAVELPKKTTVNVALRKNAQNFRVDVKMGPRATLRLDASLRRPWKLSQIIDGNGEKVTQFKPNVRVTNLRKIRLTFTMDNGVVQLSVKGRNISKKFPLPGNHVEAIEVTGDVYGYSVDTDLPVSDQTGPSETNVKSDAENGELLETRKVVRTTNDGADGENEGDAKGHPPKMSPKYESALRKIITKIKLKPDTKSFVLRMQQESGKAWQLDVDLPTQIWRVSSLSGGTWKKHPSFKNYVPLAAGQEFDLTGNIINGLIQFDKKKRPYTLADAELTLRPNGRHIYIRIPMEKNTEWMITADAKTNEWTCSSMINGERLREVSYQSNHPLQYGKKFPLLIFVKAGVGQVGPDMEKAYTDKYALPGRSVKGIMITGDVDVHYLSAVNYPRDSMDSVVLPSWKPTIHTEDIVTEIKDHWEESNDYKNALAKRIQYITEAMPDSPSAGMIFMTMKVNPNAKKFHIVAEMDEKKIGWILDAQLPELHWVLRTVIDGKFKTVGNYTSKTPMRQDGKILLLTQIHNGHLKFIIDTVAVPLKCKLPATIVRNVIALGDVESFEPTIVYWKNSKSPQRYDDGSFGQTKIRPEELIINAGSPSSAIGRAKLTEILEVSKAPPKKGQQEKLRDMQSIHATVRLEPNAESFAVHIKLDDETEWKAVVNVLTLRWTISSFVNGRWIESLAFKSRQPLIQGATFKLIIIIDIYTAQILINGQVISPKCPLLGESAKQVTISGDVDVRAIRTVYWNILTGPEDPLQAFGQQQKSPRSVIEKVYGEIMREKQEYFYSKPRGILNSRRPEELKWLINIPMKLLPWADKFGVSIKMDLHVLWQLVANVKTNEWILSSYINGTEKNKVSFKNPVPLTTGKLFRLTISIGSGESEVMLNNKKVSPVYAVPGRSLGRVVVTGDVIAQEIRSTQLRREPLITTKGDYLYGYVLKWETLKKIYDTPVDDKKRKRSLKVEGEYVDITESKILLFTRVLLKKTRKAFTVDFIMKVSVTNPLGTTSMEASIQGIKNTIDKVSQVLLNVAEYRLPYSVSLRDINGVQYLYLRLKFKPGAKAISLKLFSGHKVIYNDQVQTTNKLRSKAHVDRAVIDGDVILYKMVAGTEKSIMDHVPKKERKIFLYYNQLSKMKKQGEAMTLLEIILYVLKREHGKKINLEPIALPYYVPFKRNVVANFAMLKLAFKQNAGTFSIDFMIDNEMVLRVQGTLAKNSLNAENKHALRLKENRVDTMLIKETENKPFDVLVILYRSRIYITYGEALRVYEVFGERRLVNGIKISGDVNLYETSPGVIEKVKRKRRGT
ncbi:Gal-bind lectin domain containing protein [Trichuris trichiura]|uniref:Gal-bind lectin domain containing protein n=1 Tax=Trichuris trichiura TaxID=36087 RepID=A0A077YWX2_TRITR|nr:Gal-bind lectin domain containing protein [Trichuris trichiura]